MCLKSSFKFIAFIIVLSFFGCNPSGKGSSPDGDRYSLDNFSKYHQEFIGHYQKLLKNNPGNLDLKRKLAKFYYNFKDYERVKGLLQNMDDIEAKIILAKTFVKLKEYDYAIEIFEKLMPEPENSEYNYLYGQALEEKNLFPKAIKVYKKVGPPFKDKALKRIMAIKFKVEDVIPKQVLDIYDEAKSFIEESKNDAAITLLVEEDIEIRPDNTSLSKIHVIDKVLKERGKKLAEVEIGYDSTYERVELEFARTITKDGKVIYAGEQNIRDVGRYLNYPLYSNSRAFIISMPSVDVGSFIEYKINIYSSKLVNQDDFTFIYRLRESSPIFRSEFRLIIPEDKEANFKFFNQGYSKGINLHPSVSTSGGKKEYFWRFDKIKPIIPEYGMPPKSLVNPAILISSFSSWDEIYKWWRSLYEDKLELTQETQDFVRNIIKDEEGALAKAKKIHEYVAKDIRYVAIEYGDGGHEPHYAQEVFTNRYGDCKDQAMLLVAMLKVAGISAHPVLIPTRRVYSIDEDFPSLNFNHAICALYAGEDLIFMDPTAETVPFRDLPLGDQNRLVMLFLDDSYKLVNTPGSSQNEVIYSMDININDQENAVITRSVKTEGFFAAGYRSYLKYTHPVKIEDNIRDKMTEISSLSRLLTYNISNADSFDGSPALTYKFIAEKILNPANNLRIVPVLDQIYLDYSLIAKEQRKYPIDFNGLYSEVGKIKIYLPESLKLKYLPRSISLENLWFKLEVSYKDYPEYIDFYQKFSTKKRFVEVEEYDEFKKVLKDAIYLLREEIILEVKK